MLKRVLLFTIICGFFAAGAFAQAAISSHPTLDPANPNYAHDRITYMWVDSQNEEVSQFDLNVLHNQAAKNNLPDEKVMRSKYIFQIIRNAKLSIDDRIFAADFFINLAEINHVYPAEYLKLLKANLLMQKK